MEFNYCQHIEQGLWRSCKIKTNACQLRGTQTRLFLFNIMYVFLLDIFVISVEYESLKWFIIMPFTASPDTKWQMLKDKQKSQNIINQFYSTWSNTKQYTWYKFVRLYLTAQQSKYHQINSTLDFFFLQPGNAVE